MYKIEYHKRAVKEISKLKQSKLESKAKQLIEIIKENPYQNPPPYEKLIGDLNDLYSRRISIQHRLVYKVIEEQKVIRIISMWSHYENIWKIPQTMRYFSFRDGPFFHFGTGYFLKKMKYENIRTKFLFFLKNLLTK